MNVRPDLRDDAYRLANGTPGIASLYAIQSGVEIIAQVGVEAIRQTTLLIDLAQRAGYQINTPLAADQRAGTVTVNMDNSYAISRALLARNIVIDYREGAGIRIAPHFYTTDEEVHAAISAIGEIIAEGSWKPFSQNRAFVT